MTRFPRLELAASVGHSGGVRWGCAASSYIPDPLSRPLPPPPLPPAPRQAARAPALREATREHSLDRCRLDAPGVGHYRGDPEGACPHPHRRLPCALPPRWRGPAGTCWRPQPQAEPLPRSLSTLTAKSPVGGNGNTAQFPFCKPRFARRAQGPAGNVCTAVQLSKVQKRRSQAATGWRGY